MREDKGWAAHTPGCVLGGLSIGVWLAVGVPFKGPKGPSSVTFATHHSFKIRAGANGAWPQGNWLGAQPRLSPGRQRPAVTQPRHLQGQRPPVLAWPRIKFSVAAFQGSTRKKGGGQKGKALFSCLLLHLHKVKNVSIETTRVCNF